MPVESRNWLAETLTSLCGVGEILGIEFKMFGYNHCDKYTLEWYAKLTQIMTVLWCTFNMF